MHESFVTNLRAAAKGSSTVREAQFRSTTRRMRSSRRPEESKKVHLQLVEIDGVMEWEETTGALPDLGQFRRGRSPRPSSEGAVVELEFDRLPPSKITQFLSERDKSLTPSRGLRRYNPVSGKLVKVDGVQGASALVLIHGTFSNSDNCITTFNATAEGQEFLKRAAKHYKGNVFAFDHPTLSVGPILNALDLARYFKGQKTKVDLVCHSRGGLVGRWWADAIDPNGNHCRKAVFVGSPLAGTGLTAPPNIRSTINMLTKYGDAMQSATGAGSFVIPVLSVVECLLRVVTSITSLAAKTPVVDAAMAMVPGLFAMSRVGNNPELLRLLEAGTADADRYHAIISNFEPTDPTWKFWRAFRKERIANFASDAIFDGANDLVVDTDSMDHLAKTLRISSTLDFEDSTTVHHLNYFQQPRTIEFLSETLL